MTPEPRDEPASVHTPDPDPDTEAVQMIFDMAREAVYLASEDGSDQYRKRPDRWRTLLRLCESLTDPQLTLEKPNHAIDAALRCDYERAARFVEIMQEAYFGARPTGFRDATLESLCRWLRRREETRYDNCEEFDDTNEDDDNYHMRYRR